MEISDTNGKAEQFQDKGDTPEGRFMMKVIFTIFGIGSLLAWNAILSDLGFFINFQREFDPSTSFSFLNFALNIVFQFIMICKKQLISYKVQLIFGLLASVVTLVFLPIIVISFEKNSTTGFIFTALVILFQGLVNAFCCSGFYGLTSFFPMEMIIALSTGQGISGILMNIIQYIVLASVNTGNADNDAKYGAIIFFSISGLILLICFVILLSAFKTEYFKYYLSQTKDFNQSGGSVEKVKEGPITRNTGDEDDDDLMSAESSKHKEVSFGQLSKLLLDIDILSMYIYIITFALFPSCSISQRLFEFGKYRQCTIITIYNVCDTIGRSIVSVIKPTKILSYIVILGRTILLFTFIFVFYCDQKLEISPNLSSILLIINVSALALTNGVGTSLCFGIAPSLVPDELKGRAGSSVGFFNILGIFIGTCLAFLTMFIMGKIGKYE